MDHRRLIAACVRLKVLSSNVGPSALIVEL
jgi:hypothetical protein